MPPPTRCANAGTGELGLSGDGGPALEARLGASGDTVNLVTNSPATARLNDEIVISGSRVQADNGDEFELRLIDGAWVAEFVPFECNRTLHCTAETVALTTREGEGGTWWLDGRQVEGTLTARRGTLYRVISLSVVPWIETIAGTGEAGYNGDTNTHNVFAREAQLRQPSGLEVANRGATVYVADTGNHRIRRIDWSSGEITTVAGLGPEPDDGDGGSTADIYHLSGPLGVALGSSSNLFGDPTVYVADTGNHRVGIVRSSCR